MIDYKIARVKKLIQQREAIDAELAACLFANTQARSASERGGRVIPTTGSASKDEQTELGQSRRLPVIESSVFASVKWEKLCVVRADTDLPGAYPVRVQSAGGGRPRPPLTGEHGQKSSDTSDAVDNKPKHILGGLEWKVDTVNSSKAEGKTVLGELTRPEGWNSPRGLALLAHVARHRFLSSAQLGQARGWKSAGTLRCLRSLFDHGYLDRRKRSLRHCMIKDLSVRLWSGSKRSAHAAGARHRIDSRVDWSEKNKRAGAIFLAHTLEIADFMVSLELACRAHGQITMIREEEILAAAPEETRAAREPLRWKQ